MGANDPRDVASLDPMGLTGRIYAGDTKYRNILNKKKLWVSWFQKRRFFKFFHYKSLGDNDICGVENLHPRGIACRIYVGDH